MSSATGGDTFGEGVDIDADVAVVGAETSGIAYVYRKVAGTWELEDLLFPDPSVVQPGFARAVAVDGDVIVVGSFGHDTTIANDGALYVFRYNGIDWDQEALLTDGVADGGWLGWSVDVSGGVIIGGAYAASGGGVAGSGGAAVFRYQAGAWSLEQNLESPNPSSPSSLGGFGHSVSISPLGNRLAVGAPNEDPQGPDSGSLYVYRFSGGLWSLEQQIVAPLDAGVSSGLGFTLALDDEFLIAGAVDAATAEARAFIYSRSGTSWSAQNTFIPPIPATSFGLSVGLSQGVGVLGATAGTAFVFPVPFEDCDDDGIPDECQIELGAADCDGNGIPDACELLGQDCNGNGVLDSCDIAAGVEDDCNDNGIPDSCEILDGTAPDCNGNLRIDSCEIEDGSEIDCNENGIPDVCDLETGRSADLNENGVPDECDKAVIFRRGDANDDTAIDIGDPIAILTYLFGGGGVGCLMAADVNGDAGVDIADSIYELDYLFNRGASPPMPFPDCGDGVAVLPCSVFESCP